jgi:hydrogenase/urease accessory protein HupE
MTRGVALRLGALLLVLFSVFVARPAQAHEIDSASLSLTEVAQGRFLVRFHAASVSLQTGARVPAVFPKPCRMDGAYLDCGPSGLVGPIEFPWLEGTLTRLMVEIQWRGGSRLLRIVSASAPSLTVYGVPASGLLSLKPIVVDYTRLGIEHILTGFDHLLFVIALAILVRSRRQLFLTITAFTLAHSLTLASTALGLLSVPVAPVEATIALSIVLVCAECLRPAESFTRRAPWLVAFAFGLLHGLGFASALLEIGLPEQHLPAALFCFNVGVELGQLTVIGAFLALRALAVRLKLQRAWLTRGLVYAMGSVAAFWSLDRVVAVFGG